MTADSFGYSTLICPRCGSEVREIVAVPKGIPRDRYHPHGAVRVGWRCTGGHVLDAGEKPTEAAAS